MARPRHPFRLPEAKRPLYERARRLEFWTIGWMLSIVLVMYLAMGNSQAMKAAWIEDILSLVPPIAWLWASRFEFRPPNERFPFGYLRSMQLAFLGASTALLILGIYLVADAAMTLATRSHPTIGTTLVFGEPVWAGWIMIAALTYSTIPPLILGRKKLQVAAGLWDDVLDCDADMNRADWATAIAGVIGVSGIAMGWWWCDAVAAGLIGLDVVRDGVKGMIQVVRDLMDHVPTQVGNRHDDPITERLHKEMMQLDWVDDVELRLREQGRVVTGTAFVVPGDDTCLLDKLREAEMVAERCHWRIYDVDVRPVRHLKSRTPGEELPPASRSDRSTDDS